MTSPARLARLGVLAAIPVAATIALPAQAHSASDIRLTVENKLPQATTPGYPQVAILEPRQGQLYCWDSRDLSFGNRERNAVPRGESRTFYTTTVQGNAPCLTAYGDPALDLGVYVRLTPGSKWITVGNDDRARSMSLRFEKAPGRCNWNKTDGALQYCFVLRRSLPTFSVPEFNFKGLLCWTVRSTADNNTLRRQAGKMTITVRGDAACNTPRGQTIFPSESGAPVYADFPAPENAFPSRASAERARENQVTPPPPAGDQDEPGGDNGEIVSFMSSSAVACQMLGILPDKRCAEVARNDRSSFDELTTDVRKFRITNSFGTVNERHSICSALLPVPRNVGKETVNCKDAWKEAKATTTATSNGGKIGGAYTKNFKYTSPDGAKIFLGAVESQHSINISGEWNFSRTNTIQNTKEKSREISVGVDASPGFLTRVEVFTQQAEAYYNYDADLDVGARDKWEPVITPAAEALGMSPSRNQNCLAYLIGGTAVNGSIMERQKRLLDSGVSPINPGLSPQERGFMRSAPYYRAGSTACPGMPSMFPAVAGFTGKGVGTYESLGYGDDGRPLTTWTVCVYVSPLTSSSSMERTPAPRGEMQGDSNPCVKQKNDDRVPVKVPRPGVLVNLNSGAGEAQSGGRGRTFDGTNRSDQVIGTPYADTIDPGRGAFQIVRAGGGDDHVTAAEGTDQVLAGPGNDTVIAGSRDIVFGDQGNDTLSVSNAQRSQLIGGPGDDTLRSDNSRNITMSGGPGADSLQVTGTSSGVSMGGGPGNDTYTISATSGSRPRVFEMPNEGVDTIVTDRNFSAPLYVERMVASGAGPVNLTSPDGRQTLIGNDASNVLSPGAGPDVAMGGGGNDVFLMGWDAPDTVTGGPGADLFVPLGTPATARYGALAPDARSHRITDFNPQEGDRIELRASVFGIAVRKLPTNWRVATGAAPTATTPNATILANTSTGLLAFDRDGSGPVIPKVFAMVPNPGDVGPSWFTIA